jgi:hypothetical protein
MQPSRYLATLCIDLLRPFSDKKETEKRKEKEKEGKRKIFCKNILNDDSVFRDMKSCNLVDIYHRCASTCYVHFQVKRKQKTDTHNTSVNFHQPTRRHIP